MYAMRFIDGTTVDADYAEKIAKVVSSACLAEEIVGIDELEAFAVTQQAQQNT